MNSKNTQKATVISSLTLAALALAGCGTTTQTSMTTETPPVKNTPPVKEESPTPVTSTPESPTNDPMPVATSTPTSHTYRDGTYSTVGSYHSPAGDEEIGVTITLKNDIITDVTVVPKATAMRSVVMQKDFVANYKSMVVGKNITEVNLGKVSGASLTPKGFNDAILKIEAQAK